MMLTGKKNHYDHHKSAWNDMALNLSCFVGSALNRQDTVIKFDKILKIVHQDHLLPGIGCLMLKRFLIDNSFYSIDELFYFK
jgi:hypothetical protein